MLSARMKLWIERDGSSFFGDGRAALLEAIDRTGSLSQAARTMRMSYRTAWENINQMETAFARQLVVRQTGGSQGGGCTLTEGARALLAAYARFREELEKSKETLFQVVIDAIDEQGSELAEQTLPQKRP